MPVDADLRPEFSIRPQNSIRPHLFLRHGQDLLRRVSIWSALRISITGGAQELGHPNKAYWAPIAQSLKVPCRLGRLPWPRLEIPI